MFAGLELTFANNFTINRIVEDAITLPTIDIVNNFMANLNKAFTYKEIDDAKVVCKLAKQVKNIGGASAEANNLRVVITPAQWQNERKLVDFERPKNVPEGSWSFNVSIDPDVIEVQTDPAWWDANGPEEDFISDAFNLIFNVMTQVHIGDALYPAAALAPHPTRGGGHVNIDARTAGIKFPVHVLNMMLGWQDHPGRKQQTGDGGLIEVSAQNQAVVRDDRCKNLFSTGEEVLAGPNELQTGLQNLQETCTKQMFTNRGQWKKVKTEITDLLYQFPQKAIIKPGKNFLASQKINDSQLEAISDARTRLLHNQAINIEHLGEDENGAIAGRIEFREFRAQNGLAQVTQSVRICSDVIEKATKS